jgi:hypothetical protein
MNYVFMLHESLAMTFNSQAIFANLAEKEKVKGHHSPEGRAIRTLSRALNGWSMAALSAADVLILCNQTVEDWLKSRLDVSAWSTRSLPALLAAALDKALITGADAVRLQDLHHAGRRLDHAPASRPEQADAALEFCIQLVERHW